MIVRWLVPKRFDAFAIIVVSNIRDPGNLNLIIYCRSFPHQMRSTDQANLLPRPFLLDAATDDLMDVDVGEPCVRSKFEIFKVLDPIFHRRADLSIASDEGTNSNA